MAKAYYSTVFEQPAEDIWAIVRDFNNYSVWLADTESRIENGKSGDAVGAIRNVRIADRTIRQRLLAHSDRPGPNIRVLRHGAIPRRKLSGDLTDHADRR